MTESDVLSNQTNFFDQELLEQTPTEVPVEVDPEQAEKDLKKKKQKQKLILIGTSVITVLFVVLAILVVVAPEPEFQLNATPSPIAFGTTEEETRLKKRLDEVEVDLRAADPIQLNAPFPPVNFTLFLDPPPRR
jgi:hypothetical protein